MEYLEGEALSDRLARGLMPMRELVGVAIEMADALDYAHRSMLPLLTLPVRRAVCAEGAATVSMQPAGCSMRSTAPSSRRQ